MVLLMSFQIVVLSVIVAVVVAEEYKAQYAPTYNYGPDNAEYYYAVENYDPYLYKNAYVS